MRTILTLIALLTTTYVGAQYSSQASSNFPDLGRDDGVAFSTKSHIYYGAGMEVGFNLTNNFYRTNAHGSNWEAIPDLPSTPRQYAAACGCESYGIVAGGINSNGDELDDVWLYNETYNSWSLIANLPSGGRQKFIAECYYQNIIIGLGHSNGSTLNSFWRYNIPTGVWHPYSPSPIAIENGISFIIKDTLYVGLGQGSQYFNERLFALDLTNDVWTEKATFPVNGRIGAIGENLGEMGFVGLGMDSSQNFYNDFYVFEASKNLWSKTFLSIEDSLRGAKAAVLGSHLIISTGLNHGVRSNSTWAISDLTYQMSQSGLATTKLDFEDAPTGNYELWLYDMQGREVRHWPDIFLNQDRYLELNNVLNGMYLIRLQSHTENQLYVGKTVVLGKN
jgi:N-acetylneuraminic acid mutarotase